MVGGRGKGWQERWYIATSLDSERPRCGSGGRFATRGEVTYYVRSRPHRLAAPGRVLGSHR